MNGVAGVIVLYHPDIGSVMRNIASYIGYLQKLYVIDNSEQETASLRAQFAEAGNKILYLHNGRNEGIAAALNQAASRARNDGYAWLLTMDQDSYFEQVQINRYFEAFRSSFESVDRVAVVAPTHQLAVAAAPPKEFEEVPSVITSGSLVHLGIWHQLQGFDEKLFIDEVDHEYCYRARRHRYQVIRFYSVILQHEIGKKKKAGYFGLFQVRERTIHHPARLYFIVRNYLYVRRKYKKFEQSEFAERDRQVGTIIKNNLLFSGRFFAVLFNICKGFLHYKRNIFPAAGDSKA